MAFKVKSSKQKSWFVAKVAAAVLLVLLPKFELHAQLIFFTNNDAITISGYDGTNSEVVIPSMTNGLPVTTIGTNAFIGSAITKISLADSITSIEYQAFWGCFGLTNIVMPDSVTRIGNLAFYDCINLSDVTLGNNVKDIGFGAFDECYRIKGIVLPNSLTNLDDKTFWDCLNLTNISIPAGVMHIGTAAFFGCFNLMAIQVDKNNQAYDSVAGVLFDKGGTTLIEFPQGMRGDYQIPTGVTNVGAYAFGLSDLNSVLIPNSVQIISDYAFEGSGGFTTFTIPNSVTSIGNGAFDDCPWLNTITIGSGVKNIGDYAFAFNGMLVNVFFVGNATTNIGTNIFVNDSATVYYLPATTGWDMTFGGLPTQLWNPQIQTSDGSFGVLSNQFGFNIIGAANIPVVVEACTNVGDNWLPLQSVNLVSNSWYFVDAEWTNYPARFYRIRSP